MRESGDDLALSRDAVGVDLLVKRLAEGDRVFCAIVGRGGLMVIVEPKSNPIEEVKTCPVSNVVSTRLIVGAKEDGGCEDPLEALNDAAIMTSVLSKTEEVQHLTGGVEADDPARLLHSECRYPDGNEPILTKGQTESGMPGNLKEELAVAASVGELIFAWWAKRKAAEHEGASVVGEVLLATLPFLADEGYGLELP
jgi:hypothetical protein